MLHIISEDQGSYELFSSIFGIVFMSTPHRSTGTTNLREIVSNILELNLSKVHRTELLIDSFEVDPGLLVELSRGCRRQNIRIATFYEVPLIGQPVRALVSMIA